MAFTFSGVNINGSLQAAFIAETPLPTYSLFTWGNNSYGQLGDGTTTNRSSPTLIGSPTYWASVSSRGGNSAAIKTDGTLWVWGQGLNFGSLGLGVAADKSSPTQVGSLTDWQNVYVYYENAAIKTDGTLWVWGRNALGGLGLGNTTYYSSPKQVGALTTWSKASVANYNIGAIKTDGTLWIWGSNSYGQLGQGNTTHRSSPVQVGALTTWSSIALSVFGGVNAIKTDGTIWALGRNNRGQLGLSDTVDRSSPVQIGALTNWLKVSAGAYHVAAIKTDGTLWTWGFNYGRLGLNTATHYSSPKQVGSLTTWSKVEAGSYGSVAIKTDGTLWTWSAVNSTGFLGDGSTTDKSSPVQVGSSTSWTQASAGGTQVLALALYS